jgi:hypothetical protein
MTFGMGEARRDRSSIDAFDPCHGSLPAARIPETAGIRSLRAIRRVPLHGVATLLIPFRRTS